MHHTIALEALSALTGCTVKLRPAGGAQGSPDDGISGGGNPAFVSLFNSLSTRDDQAAVPDFGVNELSPTNELTIKNLIPTIFVPETFLILRSIGDSVQCFLPDISIKSSQDTPAPKKELYVTREEFFSPGYDYDFRGSEEPSECSRGGEPYTRPWGWYRFALQVKDTYPEGNTWLGSHGWRNQSSPGEWPVSFHGTSIKGAKGIIVGHYEPGSGDWHGYGIYSTPDIEIAESYASTFKSETDGKTYKAVMQNRINPEKRTITNRKDYWLIKIERSASKEEVKKIVMESIRPYGILIKEVE